MSNRTDKKQNATLPLVRIRQMILIIGGIALLLAGPLLLVWKQAYIRVSSVRLEAMTDTLSLLDKQISQLRLKGERLSSVERIETFAQTSLGLEYPSSDRLVIVPIDNKNNRQSRTNAGRSKDLLASAQDRLSKGGAR